MHILTINSKLTLILQGIIDCSQYSSLTCLLSVTPLVLFVRGFKQSNVDEPVPQHIQLIAEGLQHTELSWVLHIQAISFVKVFKYLRSPGKQPTLPYVQQFGLFLDDKNV